MKRTRERSRSPRNRDRNERGSRSDRSTHHSRDDHYREVICVDVAGTATVETISPITPEQRGDNDGEPTTGERPDRPPSPKEDDAAAMFQSEPIVCSSSSADNQSRRTIHSSMLYSPSRHESDMGDEEVEYSPTSSGPGGDTGGEVDYSPTHSVSRSWAENEVEASPRTTTHEPPTALNFHTCSVAENEPPPPTAAIQEQPTISTPEFVSVLTSLEAINTRREHHEYHLRLNQQNHQANQEAPVLARIEAMEYDFWIGYQERLLRLRRDFDVFLESVRSEYRAIIENIQTVRDMINP